MKMLNVQVVFLVLALNALHVLPHRPAVVEPPASECEEEPVPPPAECDETTTTACAPPSTTPPCTTTKPPCTSKPPPCTTTTPPCTTPEPECTTTECPATKIFSIQTYSSRHDCVGMEDGTKMAALKHCRCYYVCYHNKAKRIRCPRGQWFDRELDGCFPRSEVRNCPPNRN